MPVSTSISCSARRLALIEPRRAAAAGCGTAAATALGLTMEFEHSCLGRGIRPMVPSELDENQQKGDYIGL